jgi:hypothetical protein
VRTVRTVLTVRAVQLAALNLALAVTLVLLAPAEPIRSDRNAYDYVGQAPFAPNCPVSIYCYRPLAPILVHNLPINPDLGWRAYQVLSNAAAGTVMATVGATLSAAPIMPLLVSVMAQTSYGFTFTAYDPYTADPLVFLIAALLTWCWVHDRVGPAVALSTIGIFAKETVALVTIAIALAAIIARLPGWRRWLIPAAASITLLAAFHVISRVVLNWEIASNPAAHISQGSWLGLWWRNNPFIERKVYMIFATFGFGWIFAALGWRLATPAWRALAIATIPAMAALIVVQTPERALGNAFVAVIPLAALFAVRAPALGWVAIALNALITAKAGSSSPWLPSARITLILAAAAAIALVVVGMGRGRAAPQPRP